MPDPVVDAATRAMKKCHGYPDPNYDMVVAAREALAPVRELFQELWKMYSASPHGGSELDVLREFEPLIYPSEGTPDV